MVSSIFTPSPYPSITFGLPLITLIPNFFDPRAYQYLGPVELSPHDPSRLPLVLVVFSRPPAFLSSYSPTFPLSLSSLLLPLSISVCHHSLCTPAAHPNHLAVTQYSSTIPNSSSCYSVLKQPTKLILLLLSAHATYQIHPAQAKSYLLFDRPTDAHFDRAGRWQVTKG